MDDLFSPAPGSHGHRIRVGIGGWVYAPWRDNFYPAGLVQRRELEFASRQLTAIEINGTYYGTQKPATYAKWRDETPRGFVFSAKAPRRITQSRTLAKTAAQVEDFVAGIAELGDKLGPLVWQFDAGTRLDHDDFSAFASALPTHAGQRRLRHVLDVRDASFINPGFLALARQHGLATVFTDSTEHPSYADLTADFVYARLMRSQSGQAHGYPALQLNQWAQRARQWSRGEAPQDLPYIEKPAIADRQETGTETRDVFIYFISAAKERNPAAAMALIQRLSDEV